MGASPDDTTSDLHAVIAALRAERDAALARDAKLDSDYAERAARQGATVEVLQAMAASPGNPKPVFEAIVRRARDLCDAYGATLAEVVDGSIVLRAYVIADEAAAKQHEANFPRPVAADTMFGRAILARETVQLPNVAADQTYALRDGTLRGAVRAQAAVPLIREGEAIGAINITRQQTGEISPAQIELLQVFADQAVIAINSAETYRALQTRTSDLQETLEYQTATSDVLKVISRSTFDLQPVLDTVVEIACRLCDADQALISRRSGELWRMEANRGFPPEYEEYNRVRGAFRFEPDSPSVAARTAREGRVVHIEDVAAVPGYPEAFFRLGKHRTSLGVPLLRNGETVGLIQLARQRVEPFTNHQIELVSTFADQAVIAIENTRLMTEQREALEQQTATAEVLEVINSSPGDLGPVFQALLRKAHSLCEASFGALMTYDGERFHAVAHQGTPAPFREFLGSGLHPRPGDPFGLMVEGAAYSHIHNLLEVVARYPGEPLPRAAADLGGIRTLLVVPLRKDSELLGVITAYRQETRPFSDRQIALLQNFAAQAVVAMENARLLTETREALEQQTATAEVLQVINTSPGDLSPVFDAILEKAHNLCSAHHGGFYITDGEAFRAVAVRGMPDAFADLIRQPFRLSPNHPVRQLIAGTTFAVVHDASEFDDPIIQKVFKLTGMRSALFVPLRKDKVFLGYVVASSPERRAFTEKQVALLQNFAAQAVIAMENARLLDEIRQRQAELRVTFDNMGDGVVMFDGEHHLAAWNRNFQELLDIPDAALAKRPGYADYLRLLAERGEFGTEDIEAELARRLGDTDRELRLERTRPDGRVIELRRNPVPDGGFVLIYSDISERKRSEAEIRAARDAAEAAYRDLKAAQANLIQAEKMASLGQLTAGIAHEIKNPLNFVNNFAELSIDLLGELKDAIAPAEPALTEKQRAEVEEVSGLLTSNLEKITEHGKRADSIVRAMLEHSRGSSGERRMVDLNALIDEALNLAYHGARAQDQNFNITLQRDFGEGIAPIELNPQEMTRVLLNLFANGFYAVTRRAREGGGAGFVPTLKVTTRDTGEAVEIRVRDNGTGIPADISDKLFQPFFTTKPTGEGTGLGLSITYDIVTQQHGGSITVDSKVGEYSEFTIRLPRNP